MGMLADICSDYGLEFPPLSEEGKAGLRNVCRLMPLLANPLDAWGKRRPQGAYPASLSILAREPAVDLLIVSQDMPPIWRTNRSPSSPTWPQQCGHGRTRQARGRRIQHFRRIDPSIRKILDDGGVPALQGSTEGVGAVAAWLDWNRALPEETAPPSPLPTDLLAELDTCGGIVPYALSTRVLAHFGITALCERLTQTPEEAKAAAEAIGYPVALKGISPDITHKTETGLVKLNIADAGALRQAWDELERSMNLHHPDARREGMLIQSMVTGDVVETIAGVNRDPAFGSAVVVGLGGIFVELLRDVSLELAPLSPARAESDDQPSPSRQTPSGVPRQTTRRHSRAGGNACPPWADGPCARRAAGLSRSQSSHGVAGRTGGTHRGHRDAGPAFRSFPQAPSVTLEK